MNRFFDTLSRIVLYAFFPNKCTFCDQIIGLYGHCCEECAKKLPYAEKNICPMCGLKNCACARQGAFYDKIISPFYYLEPIRGSIHRFKFKSARSYAKTYAEYIYDRIVGTNDFKNADVITFVPLVKRDKNKRGYNQSELIAKELSSLMNIPAKPLLRKIRRTQKQHDLNAAQRKENLIGAFEVVSEENVRGETVLLCDDVITTGSTLNETSKMLKNAGAESVICCVVASAYCAN